MDNSVYSTIPSKWLNKKLINMVIMDAYYSSSRLIELWQNIDQLHLSYLEMEDSPEKIEQRIKLEDCIREYLCIAAHSQKFVFRETGDVLYRSACNKRDFSGYKASTGWNAIQLYAGNLLSQPWRKEYRQIKTYCGFYKHQIEANLVGAEVMFEAMGYKHSNGGILMLDGPICPDRVTNVSKDCLIAYVECQIIKAIWEELSQTFNITWLEVLEFRKTHLCSPEQSIRALTYQYHHKQYQDRNYTQGSDNFYNNYNTINNNNNNSSNARCLANYQDIVYPPITGYNHIPVPGGMIPQQLPTTIPPPPPPPLPTSQYLYGSNGCCGYGGNYGTYTTPHYSYPLPLPPIKSAPTNGYYCGGGNGYIPQPVYDYHQQQHHHHHHHRVPTGQLIELDAHDGGCGSSNNNNNSQTNHNNNNNNSHNNNNNNSSSNNKNQEKLVKNCDKDGVFEDWDYVYKNLESQGYTKDLGERGDILCQQMNEKQQRKKPTTKVTNLNDVLNNLSVNDRPLKINEALERYEQEQPTRNVVQQQQQQQQQHERKPSQSSSYENLSEHKKVPTTTTTTVTKSTKVKIPPPQQQQKEKSKTKNENMNNRWECKTCTFLNDNSHDICEMCSKSRTNIEQQMEIGGAECSKCTLVNPKDKNICQACGASLKNSPTYI